jgi:hypothetical protein
MQLELLGHGIRLIAPLDSNSTHNFVYTTAMERAEITLLHRASICIAITNGYCLTNRGLKHLQ